LVQNCTLKVRLKQKSKSPNVTSTYPVELRAGFLQFLPSSLHFYPQHLTLSFGPESSETSFYNKAGRSPYTLLQFSVKVLLWFTTPSGRTLFSIQMQN